MARSKTGSRLFAIAGCGRPRPRWLVLIVAALPAAVAPPAWALRWEVVPTLGVNTVYTDNVALAPAALKRDDLVTTVAPGLSVNVIGGRMRIAGNIGLQALHRAETGATTFTPQLSLNTVGSAELVPQLLYFESRNDIGQQNVSLLGAQADSNVNATGNRATVQKYVASPYLRRNFGSDAQGELRLTSSSVSSNAAASTDSVANVIDARIKSGPAFRLTTWDLAYSLSQTAYSSGIAIRDQTSEKISARGRRLITPVVGLIVDVGYEDHSFVTNGRPPRGASWSTGFDWTPTPRTRLAATAGKRYYGSSYSFELSHRTRLTTWSAGYSEEITNTHAQAVAPTSVGTASYLDGLFRASEPDPIARQQAVQNFITQNALPENLVVPVNFLTSRNFLSKRWQGSFAINWVRNTLVANGFSQVREAQDAGGVAGDFATSGTIRQTGGTLLWNWRIATQTTSNMTLGFTRNEFTGTSRTDDTSYLTVALTRQFQPKLSGSVSFRSRHTESNVAGAGYSENAVSAGLNMRF